MKKRTLSSWWWPVSHLMSECTLLHLIIVEEVVEEKERERERKEWSQERQRETGLGGRKRWGTRLVSAFARSATYPRESR